MAKPNDEDLFSEEQSMVTMSFGDHLEELRMRLLLAVIGLAVGMIIMLVPPFNLGMHVMVKMQEPAQRALDRFYDESAARRKLAADAASAQIEFPTAKIPAASLFDQLRKLAPKLELPDADAIKDQNIELPLMYPKSSFIQAVKDTSEPKSSLITLSPLETVAIFLMVCLVAGLVSASPWVFYQIWAFIAAGLYAHERKYVYRFLPLAIILFLGGVALAFFVVLPITLDVLLQFNIWLGAEPTWRISDWMGFATILPLVFGLCFQTPMVMFFLERIGIFSVKQYREKRKFAILLIVAIAAILTPDPTVISQLLLAGPMVLLYELGIIMVAWGRDSEARGLAKAP